MNIIKTKHARPLYETVYETLKERITDGTLRSGEALSEVQLADMLSVSRTPVRDAVRRLVPSYAVNGTRLERLTQLPMQQSTPTEEK